MDIDLVQAIISIKGVELKNLTAEDKIWVMTQFNIDWKSVDIDAISLINYNIVIKGNI